MNSIERVLSIIAEEMKAASESRKKVYEVQQATAKVPIRIGYQLERVEHEMQAIRPTNNECLAMREQVRGAGRVAARFWKIGLIAFAG